MQRRFLSYFIIFTIISALVCFLTVLITKRAYPRIIWSYWNNDNVPVLQQNILNRRIKLLPNFTSILITDKTLHKYITTQPPKNFYNLKPQAQSDWVRLAVLAEHGGTWMDITIIINSPEEFEKIYIESINKQSDLTGFYLEKHMKPNNPFSFFESWFIMVSKESSIIKGWLNEFTRAIEIGFDKYREEVEIPYSCQHIYSKFNTYLTVHVALQVAYAKMYLKPRVVIYKAEDTMYKLKVECNWNDECCMKKLQNDPTIKTRIPFIKLGGGETSSTIDISTYFT